MKSTDHTESVEDLPLPKTDPSELRGKQSVRATFRLTEEAITALHMVAVHLGVKQKSLFDHLIEDIQTLEIIAKNIRSNQFVRQQRVQKTYVLSRNTLKCLERVSKSYNTPRDALVEYSIKRLFPVLFKEREKHEVRKKLAKQFRELIHQGDKLIQKANTVLEPDDPVFLDLLKALSACKTAMENIDAFVDKCKKIEDF